MDQIHKAPIDETYKDNVVGMVLKKSCVPTEPKFVPPKKGYNEFSALDVTKDQHLENHEFKSLIDHLYSP